MKVDLLLWPPLFLEVVFCVILVAMTTRLGTLQNPYSMFTGLIETVGKIASIEDQTPGKEFEIEVGSIMNDASIGDSISINGCCLTVVRLAGSKLAFQAGEETLSRTNLGDLQVGSKVNIERSLAVGDRLGGHYVTGHIDDLGTLCDRRDDPPWAHLTFRVPMRLASQIAPKGSIAIDGISLTVVDVNEDTFSVALIPHTLEATTLGERETNDVVNIETDVLAKYVERSLAYNT